MENRTTLLIGESGSAKLKNSNVIVFGLGGVGGYCVEALVRAGVGHITLVDGDVVCESNLNRQIYALSSTIGLKKVFVARQRIYEINPECEVTAKDIYYNSQTASQFSLTQYDYIVDAIDSMDDKILLIKNAKENFVPIISSMGTANRISANFSVKDIYETSNCPMARVLRQKLRKENITSLQVICSENLPDNNCVAPLSSICYVVGTAGFLLAQTVIKGLLL